MPGAKTRVTQKLNSNIAPKKRIADTKPIVEVKERPKRNRSQLDEVDSVF
jgi:hypothetical protein